ncbi:ABC transporter ATP-binding protein [Reyranella sp.]|uniref:ABC transporter ATP-binding protein n=1 Tax=Reyranella sp. TaxID=1929291 RepID=UPI003BAC2AB5
MSALLQASDLRRHYRVRSAPGLFAPKAVLRAVDGVSLALHPGRTLGLVGESGCGKSTTGKLVLGLVPPTSGTVHYRGQPLPPVGTPAWRGLRRHVQMVYQDPLGALDRRLPIGTQIEEPLIIHAQAPAAERRDRALAVMESVGLQRHQYERYPHELSGGQRQRVVLARALMTEPDLLVCDEPISALDVSIQAQVVNLLLDLQEQLGIAYLFISHDLRVVRQVSHDVAVMYLGRIVEQGEAESLFAAPAHPYTRALVSAIPTVAFGGGPKRERLLLQGDPPNPVDVPAGCAFHTRCPFATAQCRAEAPTLQPLSGGRMVACHRVHEPALQVAA